MGIRTAALTLTAAAVLIAPAPALAAKPLGTWAGTATRDADNDRGKIFIRLTITSLRVGQVAGTSTYRANGNDCRGELTLKAKTATGYLLSDRRTSGDPAKCTNGDRLHVRRSGRKLRVRHSVAGTRVKVRYVLRRM